MAISLLGPAFPFGRLLERQFALLIQAAGELQTVLADPVGTGAAAGRVRDLEQAARLTFRAVGRELGLTRLLPLERSDLHALSLALEETTLALVAVAARASLYGFTAPRPTANSLAANLVEMLELAALMLAKLRRSEHERRRWLRWSASPRRATACCWWPWASSTRRRPQRPIPCPCCAGPTSSTAWRQLSTAPGASPASWNPWSSSTPETFRS